MCEDFILDLCNKWGLDCNKYDRNDYGDVNEKISEILYDIVKVIANKLKKLDITDDYNPPVNIHFCQSEIMSEIYRLPSLSDKDEVLRAYNRDNF